MDVVIKARGLETLPQSDLRRHTINAQGCGEEIAVLELPHMIETCLTDSDEAAKAPQNVLLSDLIVRGLPFGAGEVDVADTHEFAHRCKLSIPDDRFLGDLKSQLSHAAHRAGERSRFSLRDQQAKIFNLFQ